MNQMVKKLHKSCYRDSQGERFENCNHSKVKKWFRKNEKKKFGQL